MTLSPTSLTFAAQQVGTASAAQTIVVTNSGTATLTVTQITASGDFGETDNCVGAAGGIAPNASCTVNVAFLPSATGIRSGVLTVYGNVAGGQATAQLNGAGTPPGAIVLNPVSVTFPATLLGTTSAVENITVSNIGGVTATLTTPAVMGDFAIAANTCGATLAPNTGCTVSITFTPTAAGTRTGIFSVTDSAGTQTASLGGVGEEPATDTLAPLTLSFAAQQLNTASAAQTVTLTNTGDAALTLITAQTSGDFAVVNNCGASLSGHSSCALQVTFVPAALGARTGVLTVSDQLRTQTVSLSGTGIAPSGVSLAPASPLNFSLEAVGTTSAAQTVTLTNNGGVTLAIANIGIGGDFSILASSCGSSLAAGAACVIQVAFAPTAGGARIGALTVTDSAMSSPQTLQLTGTGIDFALTASGPTNASISAGTSATYALLLTSAVNVPGSVTFTCGPLPPHATCTVSPSNPALGGSTTITVTIATSVAGAKLELPPLPGAFTPRGAIWFALLLPGGFLCSKRRMRSVRSLGSVMLLSLSVALCGALTACSVSRIIPASTLGGGTTASPTPSGSYNLVVAGTSSGLTRSVGLTLVVQ
jgi:hypothetical protein